MRSSLEFGNWSLKLSWRDSLCFGFFGFFLPLTNFVLMHTPQCQQLFLVVNQFITAGSDERIVLHQKNGFFRTDLLAIAAEDAAQHIDLEFFGRFFDIPRFRRTFWPGRDN